MRKNYKSTVFFEIYFLIILLLLFAMQSSASFIKAITLEDLCNNSSDIIIASVVSKNSYYNSDKTRIYTDVFLNVEKKIKGNFQKQDLLKLKLYGGTVNGITTFVVGAPQFTIGEKTFLFLNERQSSESKENYFSIIGSAQGKFNIFIDKETKEKKVMRDKIEIPLKLENNGISIFSADSQAILFLDFMEFIKIYNNDEEPLLENQPSSEEIHEFVTVNPNPANLKTTINYSIKTPSHVKLVIYNITGQKVTTLIDKHMSAGSHSVKFDGSDLGSGVYFYRLKSKGFTKTGKMLLLK